jgi:hypothetical protein
LLIITEEKKEKKEKKDKARSKAKHFVWFWFRFFSFLFLLSCALVCICGSRVILEAQFFLGFPLFFSLSVLSILFDFVFLF